MSTFGWAALATVIVLLIGTALFLRLAISRAKMWHGAYNDMKASYRTKIAFLDNELDAERRTVFLLQDNLHAMSSKMKAMGVSDPVLAHRADGSSYPVDYYIREEP